MTLPHAILGLQNHNTRILQDGSWPENMTDKELKRLSRSELLQLLISQIELNEKLNAQIVQLQARLDDRRILLSNAGSIAEASLQLNQVFEAAQAAAQQYLDNVRLLCEESAPAEPIPTPEDMTDNEQTDA